MNDADLFEQARAGALVEHCREWHRYQHRAAISRRNRRDLALLKRR